MPWRLERAQIRKYDGFLTSVTFCQHLERPWLWHVSTEKESFILRQVFLSDFSPAFAVFQLINEVTHLFICSLTDLCIHLFNKYLLNYMPGTVSSVMQRAASKAKICLQGASFLTERQVRTNKPSFSISHLAYNLLTSLSSHVS